MRSRRICPCIGLAVLAAIACLSATSRPAAAEDPCEHPCAADRAWFPATKRPDFHKPDPDSDCEFYRPAWQLLLYSIQEEQSGAGPRLFTYEHPDELFTSSAFTQFPKAAKGTLRLAPRSALQRDPLIGAEINQAQTNGILVDPFTSRAVYFGVHFNDVFADFIRRNGYNKVLTLKNAPSDQEFPCGSAEFKTSWRILPDGDNGTSYITTQAVISKLIISNGKVIIDPNATETKTVALVGIHVVFVLDGHPEFIWATFEHKANAPELNKQRVKMPPGAPIDATPVDTNSDWTFYRKGTAANLCNKNNKGRLQLDTAKQTLTPVTDVFRQFHSGNDDEPCVIATLNQSVHDGIDSVLAQIPAGAAKTRLAALKNYDLMGAMWLNNTAYFREGVDFASLDEDDPTKRILGGDQQLSNSTIETFSQKWIAKNASGRQSLFCFDCHRTTEQTKNGITLPAKRLNVSQSLVQRYFGAAASSPSLPTKAPAR